MKAIGACRTCLAQIEGQRGLPASCSVPVRIEPVEASATAPRLAGSVGEARLSGHQGQVIK